MTQRATFDTNLAMEISPVGMGSAHGAETSGGSPRDTLGLHLVARIDLNRLVAAIPDIRYEVYRVEPCRRWRTCQLAHLARAASGRRSAKMETLNKRRMDVLEEEILADLHSIDPGAHGLPPFAMVRRLPRDRSADDDLYETDPARAMSLVARLTGNVFIASRSPRLRELFVQKDEYWIYAADGALRGGSA